jgi:hypothetical protein
LSFSYNPHWLTHLYFLVYKLTSVLEDSHFSPYMVLVALKI